VTTANNSSQSSSTLHASQSQPSAAPKSNAELSPNSRAQRFDSGRPEEGDVGCRVHPWPSPCEALSVTLPFADPIRPEATADPAHGEVMFTLSRRQYVKLSAASFTTLTTAAARFSANAQAANLSIHTAVKDGQFMVYGAGIAAYVKLISGTQIDVVASTGSLDNLRAVNASPGAIGTVFLGSALDAVNGTGPFDGNKLTNIRALFPMYETSFQTAALADKGIASVRDLDGKRVGVGPKGGPAEVFFRGLTELARVSPIIVNGNPNDQTKQLISGDIAAFWQGSIVPIPPLKAAADVTDVTIFGIEERDITPMLSRFPALVQTNVPEGTYRGQTAPLRSVAAWNFVLAHKDMPDVVAAQLTRTVLTSANPAGDIHASAAATRRENAPNNGVVPFHPGALTVYREMGIKIPRL
jgi:uncharacterized protein